MTVGTDWFVPISEPAAEGTHVFAFPHAGGGCATFGALADAIGPRTAVWGLNLPGRQARFLEPPLTALEPLLDEVAADLARRDRPVLFGYCSGALLAFLVARRLRRLGRPPAALVVASYPAPDRAAPPRELHALDGGQFWQEILSYGGFPPQIAAEPDFREIFEPALRADYEMLAAYEYTDEPPLGVAVTVLAGDADPVLHEADVEAWRRHTTAGFQVVRMPGGHWLLDGDISGLAAAIAGVAHGDGVTGEFVRIWRDLLGTSTVDDDTNFFVAGGDSLLALRLVTEAKKVTDAPLTLMSIFRAPTPAQLAALVRGG